MSDLEWVRALVVDEGRGPRGECRVCHREPTKHKDTCEAARFFGLPMRHYPDHDQPIGPMTQWRAEEIESAERKLNEPNPSPTRIMACLMTLRPEVGGGAWNTSAMDGWTKAEWAHQYEGAPCPT